jgi:hypothetical protein
VLVLAEGMALFDGSPAQLLERAGEPGADLDRALVRFLEQHSHASAEPV